MKKIIALLLVMTMIFAFAACKKTNEDASNAPSSVSDAAENSDVAAVKAAGKFVVGITEFEPMDYKNEDGEWIGFDADMAKEFAKFLGVDAEFILINWDNKVFELNDNKIDCVWNGMTLTDEVTSSMSCSPAYMNNAQVVVVNAADADKYQSAEACKELSFAVENGSAGKKEAEKNGFKYTEVEDQATAVMEVANGKADAAIIDKLMAGAMIGEGTSYADLTYTVDLNSEEYGVGFRQGSDLVDAFAEFMAQAKEDGTLTKVAETYGVQAALIAD